MPALLRCVALAGGLGAVVAGAGWARSLEVRGGGAAAEPPPRDEICLAGCRRWAECGMADEEDACNLDCATSPRFQGRDKKTAYGKCLAGLSCQALRRSLEMNEGPAGWCAHVLPISADERDLRDELGLADEAHLLSLRADPERPGFFGREGLRIVAVFDLGADAERIARQIAKRPGWGRLPLPRAAWKLPDPPRELPRPKHGLAYCRVGAWRGGTDYDPRPCGTPGRRASRYRAAVIDLDKSLLTVVLKNYY